MIAPIIAYEFPCSYLREATSIVSTLSSNLSSFGELSVPFSAPLEDETVLGYATLDADDPKFFSCPRHTIDGIASSTILESEGSVADLLQAESLFQEIKDTDPRTDGFALEVWFTPFGLESAPLVHDQLLPIVSIAAPVATNSDAKSSDECQGRQLTIGQRGEYLELYYRDYYEYLGDDYFDEDDDNYVWWNQKHSTQETRPYVCRVLHLTQWNLSEDPSPRDATQNLHHLMVSWKKSGSLLEIFGNGVSLVEHNFLDSSAPVPPNPRFRFWDPTYRLQVFSDSPSWKLCREDREPLFPHPPLDTELSEPLTPADLPVFYHPPPPSRGANDCERALFKGSIHKVALYTDPGIDSSFTSRLYREGIETRADPFRTFFEDPQNPYTPISLIAASSEEDLLVVQGRSANISLGSADPSNSSTPLWDTMVEVTSIPLYGRLKSAGREVFVGDRIRLVDTTVEVLYEQIQDDYFSLPTTSFDGSPLFNRDKPLESFSYRLVAVRKASGNQSFDDVLVLGSSSIVEQPITILHRNHPSALVGIPEEAFVPENQPTEKGSRPWATLGTKGVLQDEADHDIDRVRIDLWTYKGTLTIDLKDDELENIAELTTCTNPTRIRTDWVCLGNKDRNMTLLGTPTAITRILSNLVYNAHQWDQSDTIVLRIYDGSGGNCISEKDRNPLFVNTTIREECFEVKTEIQVPPLSRHVSGTSRDFWRDHSSWWVAMLSLLLFVSCTCGTAFCCVRKCKRDKKLNSVAVEDGNVPVILATPCESELRKDLERFGMNALDRARIDGETPSDESKNSVLETV